jgi:hypothetical protein
MTVEKFMRCVKKVEKKGSAVNPFAVCRKATGYMGSTKNIGLRNPKK